MALFGYCGTCRSSAIFYFQYDSRKNPTSNEKGTSNRHGINILYMHAGMKGETFFLLTFCHGVINYNLAALRSMFPEKEKMLKLAFLSLVKALLLSMASFDDFGVCVDEEKSNLTEDTRTINIHD